jgi:hypothetical protein
VLPIVAATGGTSLKIFNTEYEMKKKLSKLELDCFSKQLLDDWKLFLVESSLNALQRTSSARLAEF